MSIDKYKLNNRRIVFNRRALHNYDLIETYEAGMVLKGTEVKSVRNGNVSIKEAYASFEGPELFVHNMHIPEYENRGYSQHNPVRERKLLLHKKELDRMYGAVTRKGLTLIPVKVYLKQGKVKVELALAKGKKVHDKREEIKRKDMEREIQRELKDFIRR